jgi:hypothetical protein
MGLFNRKKDAAASLDAPTENTPAKSETTTAVSSQSVSDTESLEKSRVLDTTRLNEKDGSSFPTAEIRDQAAPSQEQDATISTEIQTKREDTTIHKTKSNSIHRTTSNSIISAPGADDDDMIYPGGLKLALITLALCLSVLCVALDNTIIASK